MITKFIEEAARSHLKREISRSVPSSIANVSTGASREASEQADHNDASPSTQARAADPADPCSQKGKNIGSR
jgi:hypothetical protein